MLDFSDRTRIGISKLISRKKTILEKDARLYPVNSELDPIRFLAWSEQPLVGPEMNSLHSDSLVDIAERSKH